MSTIHRDIYITRHQRIQPIEIVSGSQIAIELQLVDYDIPAGASAKAYARERSAPNTYVVDCTISEKTVSFTPQDGFFIAGPNRLQIEINGVIIPFSIDVNCESRVSDAGDPATPEQVRPLVEQAETAAAAAEEAKNAVTALQTEIEKDYPEIPALKEELNKFESSDLKPLGFMEAHIGEITAEGTWNVGKSTHAVIPVNGGDVLNVVGVESPYTQVAAVRSYSEPISGASVDLSTDSDWSARKTVGPSGYTGIIPQDAKYLIVGVTRSAANTMPTVLKINGVDYLITIRQALGTVAQEVDSRLSELQKRLTSGKIEDAELHLGFYLDENGDLCQKED